MSRYACGPQHLSNRRLAAWLSLLALLLIYLGPLISQARALQPIPTEPTTQAHHAGTANTLALGPARTLEHLSKHASEHPEHAAEHGAAHAFEHVSAQGSEHPEYASELPPEHAAHHGTNSLGDVCGYCSLLLNSPALGNSAFMLGAVAFVDHVPARAQPRTAPLARRAFADARPRAPPAFS